MKNEKTKYVISMVLMKNNGESTTIGQALAMVSNTDSPEEALAEVLAFTIQERPGFAINSYKVLNVDTGEIDLHGGDGDIKTLVKDGTRIEEVKDAD